LALASWLASPASVLAASLKYGDAHHFMINLCLHRELTITQITGSVFVEPGHVDLGLSIKFSSKGKQVLGYTRKIDRSRGAGTNYRPGGGGSWEFTERVRASPICNSAN
jgi:hypothetical protein